MKRIVYFVLICALLLSCHDALKAQESPRDILQSAKVFLDFSSAGDQNVLAASGFDAGVALDGAEKAESLLRGGDGIVARVDKGGYATVSDEINAALDDASGREITFGLRVKCAPDVWNDSPVISRHGGHASLSFNLFCLNDSFGAEVGTTKNNSLLQTFASRGDMLDPESAKDAWHDVYCRVDGAKMEFFVDGRCYDEDFMLGDLRPGSVPFAIGAQYDATDSDKPRAGFEGEIDHVAIWNRALSNEEIKALSGGDKADSRERTERAVPENLQYWTPPGAYGVGDCMPFYVDGVFHFMYLLDKKRHGSKNGLGAHQWIQATSTDLRNWDHQTFVLPIDDQNEGSICTGSVFFHDGVYYAFYANRTVEFTLPDGETKNVYGILCYATSNDGIHFEKQRPQPIFFLPDGYAAGTRDPVVFVDPDDGRFHMYATTSYRGKGCWAHAVSDDLRNWTLLEPVYTHRAGEPECPDWFQWGDDYYVIANHLNGYYKKSKNPLGPWEVPDKPNVLMTGMVNVPKTAPFGDNRRIICGWTRERGFGGAAVFHELIRFEDGSLGEKFVPEMQPETGPAVFSGSNLKTVELQDVPTPENFRMTASFSYDPSKLDTMRDCCVSYAANRSARVVFSERAVYLNDVKLERVDLSSGKLELDLYATDVVVDLCVNGSRTATFASREREERKIVVNNEAEPALSIDSLTVSPLK
ncbi:MAG: hypothetical protein IJL92_05260 [Thermoguttaceae bacterium]|nr:hypothetical protein [Thermoguttaceae bacterium]